MIDVEAARPEARPLLFLFPENNGEAPDESPRAR
jgi:hypothetical protein